MSESPRRRRRRRRRRRSLRLGHKSRVAKLLHPLPPPHQVPALTLSIPWGFQMTRCVGGCGFSEPRCLDMHVFVLPCNFKHEITKTCMFPCKFNASFYPPLHHSGKGSIVAILSPPRPQWRSLPPLYQHPSLPQDRPSSRGNDDVIENHTLTTYNGIEG